MSIDTITVTVLIERKTGYREPITLARYEADSMPVMRGFACAHAVTVPELVDRDDGGAPEPCGWCQSQQRDGTRRPVDIVECRRCEGWVRVEHIAAHIRECC